MTDDKAYDGHHQVSIDKAWQLEHDDMFGRGAGDGDLYGYPGQAEAEASQPATSVSYLIEALGSAREATTSAYEAYKSIKAIEDQLRYELENMLHSVGLKSAKGSTYTASIVQKPTIIITSEADVIDWLQNAPNMEADRYIGLKTTEFKTLAQSLLKGTGELVNGTQVEIKESLSIRANTQKKAA